MTGYISDMIVPVCVSLILSVPASDIDIKFPASDDVEIPMTLY